jgi:hypothetical protein
MKLEKVESQNHSHDLVRLEFNILNLNVALNIGCFLADRQWERTGNAKKGDKG